MASSCGEDASKSALRESYLAVRKGLSPRFRMRLDGSIASNLRALPEYRRDTWLLAYVPFEDEIPTRKIVERAWADGKRVALPRCVPGPTSLQFVEVSTLDGLRAGARGVLEPAADEAAVLTSEALADSVCLVPGLVFDAEGHRIGYGAGYYDNFLARYAGTKAGLARGMQISSNPLPHDDHDVAVDVIVSDGAIWRCRRDEGR